MDESKENFIKSLEDIEVESVLNPESGEIPYGFYSPESDGKVMWICNYDSQGKLTSVFSHGNDKRSKYLESAEEAKEIKDELIKAGWKKLIPPKITFTYPGKKEGSALNRKQKRYLRKQLKKFKSPFDEKS